MTNAYRFLLLGLLGMAWGCTPANEPTCADAPYADAGRYAAGVTQLDVNGVPVEVWYPTDADGVAGLTRDVFDMRDALPASYREVIPADAPTTFVSDAYRDVPVATDGPFPLVFFSHGLGGFRQQSSFLMTHLASWGFVVVASEHPARNLAVVLEEGELADDAVAETLAALERIRVENMPGGRFAGAIDDSRIAMMGHSMGGGAVQVLVDGDSMGVSAWIGMATITVPQRAIPGLLLGGDGDEIAVPVTVERGYDDLDNTLKSYLSIARAGHLAFSDICLIGREAGGVLNIARDSGIPISDLVVSLATDGCDATDLPAEEAWPVIRQYTTEHLRSVLYADDINASNDPANACFPGLVAIYRQGS